MTDFYGAVISGLLALFCAGQVFINAKLYALMGRIERIETLHNMRHPKDAAL